MRFVIAISLLAASLSVSAEAYRWVDTAGRTVISDTPPPRSARDVSKAKDLATNPEGLSYGARKAAESFPVTLYTSADCLTECKQAREILNGRGVPFSEKMVQSNEERDELKALVGDVFVPSLKVGRQSMRGVEASAYNNLLDLAGYPKTAPAGSKPSGGLQPVVTNPAQ
jgi:glutaredoxin